jgi:hypothetical protein
MAGNIIKLNEGWRMNEGHRLNEPPAITPAPPPVLPRKKTKTMDYVPDKRDQRYRWYKNISDKVTAEAVKFGAPPADATATKTLVDGIVTKMDATDTAQGTTDSARQLEYDTEAAGLQQLRAKVKNWKTLSGWAGSGSEQVLQLSGAGPAFDPASYKTTLKTSNVLGGIRVDFIKKGVAAVNIYMRVRGTGNFHKIGMDTETPYLDSTPLTQTGVPEVREYMGRGVLHDEEIGQDSDVVSATFAG